MFDDLSRIAAIENYPQVCLPDSCDLRSLLDRKLATDFYAAGNQLQ